MIIHGPSRRGFLRGQLLSRPIAIIGEACLAEDDIICRSCEDACPELAIRFRPRTGLPPQAIVDEAVCTGCGGCASACPGDAITLGSAHRVGAS